MGTAHRSRYDSHSHNTEMKVPSELSHRRKVCNVYDQHQRDEVEECSSHRERMQTRLQRPEHHHTSPLDAVFVWIFAFFEAEGFF
eukprot:189367-Amphidinium_carterae.1